MTVFTTHTPVAAGHDRFPAALVEEHLGKLREALHLSYEDFMGLGRVYPADPNEPFCMTVLALKLVAPRQRRPRPARPGLAADVAAALPEPDRGARCRSATSPTASTSGAGSPRRCTRSSTATSGPTGSTACSHADLWTRHRPRRRRRALGDAAGPQGPADRLRPPPAGRPGRAPRRGRRGRRAARSALDLQRPDDRLRPPVRHLQARRPGPPATSSGSAELINAADRPIQFIFAGKAHPEDQLRQGADPEHRPADPAGPPFSRPGSSSSRTTT